MRGLAFLLVLGVLLFGGYKVYEWTTEDRALDFPFTRTLSDQMGRSIEAEILGIDYGMVKLRRIEDGRHFEYRLTNLSAEDQKFLQRFVNNTTSEPKMDAGALHIDNMRLKLRELERENEILEEKAADPSGYFDGYRVEHFRKEIADNESEINHLKVKIMESE